VDMEVVTAVVTTDTKVDGGVIIEEKVIEAATGATKDLESIAKEEVDMKVEIRVVTETGVSVEAGTQIVINAGEEIEVEGVGADSTLYHETPKLLRTLSTSLSYSVKPKSNRQEFSLIGTTKYPWK